MLTFRILTLALLMTSTQGITQERLLQSGMVKIDFSALEISKARIKANNESYVSAYQQLLKTADNLLKYKPVSVMEKSELPPSGDKHDYMSLAPYWWPNPATKDGLPYIRKDGQTNPEVKNYPDKNNMPVLCENVYLLSLAFYFSGNEQYAAHAAKLLQVWFLNAETKMNPNLNFGQAVKGQNTGRGAGLIDARHLTFIPDAAILLQKSPSWAPSNHAALKQWFASFFDWMNNSPIGKDERNADNNHGVWFDAQSLSFALFTENQMAANDIVKRAAGRLDKEMNENGFFQKELDRTMALHYSVFILNAFFTIADLSEQTNTNLWKVTTPAGQSLQKGLDAIYPFITQKKEWTGAQIKPFNFDNALPLLLRGSTKLSCNSCKQDMSTLAGSEQGNLILNLL
jgi:hypothetical protein